ncbi:unnamed protein product [Enterobius vermicularis]|uniref:Secreted protein n=1 Tax=Enterobius vermicularis TaxID=51028 RepID=A0A0N4VLF3_ENTVE|nr:unnamed protein product [Enterobius vermicularis]
MIYSTSVRSTHYTPAVAQALFGAARLIRSTTRIYRSASVDEQRPGQPSSATAISLKKRFSFSGHKFSHGSSTVAPTTCRLF